MAELPAILRRAVRAGFGALPRVRPTAGRAAPTVDMYLLEALADHTGAPGDGAGRPITRHTPNLFSCGSSAVIVRYAGVAEIDLVRHLGPTRVFYVIDDDLFAAGPGDGLPADYQWRLLSYRTAYLPKLLPLVTDIVAPSAAVLAGYPGKRHLRLDPSRCHAPGGLGHHDGPRGFEMVLPGTRSHLRDITHLARVVAAFLRATPEARLTTFLGIDAPKALSGLDNARHLQPLDWLGYRRFVAENRFHVALTPSLDTAFNRARSISKIHDHAGFGAASLFSNRAPFAGVVEQGVSGLLLDDDPASWLAALRQLAADRPLTRRIATGGQDLSRRVGDPGAVRAFWAKAFGTEF